MELLKNNGKGTFRLPDKLAERLVSKGRFKPVDAEPEEEPAQEPVAENEPEQVTEPKEELPVAEPEEVIESAEPEEKKAPEPTTEKSPVVKAKHTPRGKGKKGKK